MNVDWESGEYGGGAGNVQIISQTRGSLKVLHQGTGVTQLITLPAVVKAGPSNNVPATNVWPGKPSSAIH